MKKGKRAGKSPAGVHVLDGKSYFWCSCGISSKQPFCDGSHMKDGNLKPLKYLADESEDLYFCGCKKTKTPPFCDGSHSKP